MRSPRFTWQAAALAGLLIAVPCLGFAQQKPQQQTLPAHLPQVHPHGTLLFQTKIGSFRIQGTPNTTPEGRVEMSFQGTVLVTGKPKIEVQGDVQREYYNSQRQRQVYHGKGKLIVDGQFESIQWFGRDLSARWTGIGIIRFFGEYDRDLNTGSFWYEGKEAEKRFWGTFGTAVTNPEEEQFDPRDVNPRRREPSQPKK